MELSIRKIEELSSSITEKIEEGELNQALLILQPVLDSRVKFYKLDRLGLELGEGNLDRKEDYFKFLDLVVDYDAMGGYVIASKSLIPFLEDHLDDVLVKSREYIMRGDVWHVCDNMSERSVGQALVDYFEETLPWMERFLSSDERWLMRSAGVAVHFFTKRVREDPDGIGRLLDLIEPYIEVQ